MLAFILALAAQIAPATASMVTDVDGREKASEAIKVAAHISGHLYTRRVEKFEEEFLEYQADIFEGRIARGVYLYEVSEAGCDAERDEKGGRSCTTVADADPRWYVMVGKESGVAYRVSGFDDCWAEFNRMAADLHLHVNEAEKAANYTSFFFVLHFGPEGDWGRPFVVPVASNYAVRRAAEDDFRMSYGDGSYERRFDSWRKRYESQHIKTDTTVTAGAPGAPYEVSVTLLCHMAYSNPPFKLLEKEPRILRIHLNVHPNGRIELKESSAIFPAGSAKNVLIH